MKKKTPLKKPDRRAREHLEEIVGRRTAELVNANEALRREIAERKAAETNVYRRIELESFVARISSSFVGATEIDEAITSSLAEMGGFCGAGRAYVVTFKEGSYEVERTHEWRAQNQTPFKTNGISLDQYGWALSKLSGGEIIIKKPDAPFPAEAKKEKELLDGLDIDSFIAIPIFVHKQLAGAVCLDCLSEDAELDEYDLTALRISAEIIGNALERKRAEEALRESEERYRRLADTMSDGLGIQNETGRITYANDRFCEILGYPREEILGRAVGDFVHPDNAHIFAAQMEGRKKGKDVIYELAWLTKGGGKVSTLISPKAIFDSNGVYKGAFAVLTDITERRRLEEERDTALKERERVMETVPDVIYALDLVGYVSSWNRMLEEVTGYSREEVGKMHALEFFAEADRPKVADTILQVYKKGRAEVEADFLTKDRRRIRYIFSGGTLTNESGSVIGITGVGKDISELRRAEAEKEELREQLVQSQKMEAIGTLAGGMAHDFNNTLAVIMGSAETAIRMLPENDPNSKKIKKILDAARRSKDLTMKLLTFARKEKLNETAISINAVVYDLVDMLKRGISKDVRIKTSLSKTPLTAKIDINQIQQALLNICINAADAMPGGGLLTLETSETTLSEKDCGGRPKLKPGKYCLVTISDTGTGIPDNIIKKIFDPFFTTKERGKGTGLGLSITHGIVESHGGFITISGGRGKGATVHIHLPAAGDTAGDAAPPAEGGRRGKTRGGAETILVVDDDADLVEMIVEALEMEGYSPLGATSGRRAVEIYRERREDIALVILDMIMPEMDGRDTFGELKKINPDADIILCSGHSADAQARELLDDGARGYIQKPFDFESVLRTVRKTLDSGGTAKS